MSTDVENSTGIDNTINAETDVNNGDASSTTQPKHVPVENRIAEMNRKIKGQSEKIDQLINLVQQATATSTGVDNTQIDGETDMSDTEKLRQELLQRDHKNSLQKTIEIFPELNVEADNFDQKFFDKVNAEYKRLFALKDPDAPLKAARYVALDEGRYEALEREKLFKDESRRSRMLGEGVSAPKNATKAKQVVPDNLKALAQLLKVDGSKLEQHIKKNSKKYGFGES